MKIKKIKLYFITAFLINVILCQSYVTYFSESIVNETGGFSANQWASTGIFSSIIIPDSYPFLEVARSVSKTQIVVLVEGSRTDTEYMKVSLITSILWWAKRVQNSFIPSFFWTIANYNWNIVTFFNSILVLITSIYIHLICNKMNINKHSAYYISIIYLLLPINLYHSIGFIKEIPTAILMTAFVFHFLNKQKKITLLCAILLVLTRYQLIVVIGMFYLISTQRQPLKVSILLLFGVTAIYPFLQHDILESVAGNVFRQQHLSVLGIGAFVEYTRNEIPLFSSVAIVIRVLQTIYEPIIGLVTGSTDHYFNNSINVLVALYFISNIILLKMWVKSTIIIFTKSDVRRELSLILSFFLIYIIFVGGFSFISHRYISGIIPIMMIIASKYCFNFNFQNIILNTNIIMNRSVKVLK